MYTATLCNIFCIMFASNSISNASKSVSAHVKLTVYQLKFRSPSKTPTCFFAGVCCVCGRALPCHKDYAHGKSPLFIFP